MIDASQRNSYRQQGFALLERFGLFLSLRAIKKHLPRGGGQLEILELGCGFEAKLLASLRNRLMRGVGIDYQISPELKNIPELVFIEESMEGATPKLGNASFDVILFISVLEHLWEPLNALKECKRLLKPGGLLLVNVPTWTGKIFLEFSAFKLAITSSKKEIEDHKMYYSKRDLWPLLVKAGFKPSHISLSYHKFGLNLFCVVRA